jgi:hypothetical protein
MIFFVVLADYRISNPAKTPLAAGIKYFSDKVLPCNNN